MTTGNKDNNNNNSSSKGWKAVRSLNARDLLFELCLLCDFVNLLCVALYVESLSVSASKVKRELAHQAHVASKSWSWCVLAWLLQNDCESSDVYVITWVVLLNAVLYASLCLALLCLCCVSVGYTYPAHLRYTTPSPSPPPYGNNALQHDPHDQHDHSHWLEMCSGLVLASDFGSAVAVQRIRTWLSLRSLRRMYLKLHSVCHKALLMCAIVAFMGVPLLMYVMTCKCMLLFVFDSCSRWLCLNHKTWWFNHDHANCCCFCSRRGS